MFIVWPLPRYFFITGKVIGLLNANKLRGFSLTQLAAKHAQEGELTPGRVSYWLSDERVRQIAIPSDLL